MVLGNRNRKNVLASELSQRKAPCRNSNVPKQGGNKILWAHYADKVKARLGELKPTIVYIKGTDLLPPCE
jgi:hypothetical protein